jgi:hypothetical protein
MVLQKADPEVLADFYCNDGIGYGHFCIRFNGGAVMKEKVFLFLAGILMGSMLSIIVLYPVIFERGHKQGVKDAYYAKNGLQSPEVYQIAGAGDDGVVRVWNKD